MAVIPSAPAKICEPLLHNVADAHSYRDDGLVNANRVMQLIGLDRDEIPVQEPTHVSLTR